MLELLKRSIASLAVTPPSPRDAGVPALSTLASARLYSYLLNIVIVVTYTVTAMPPGPLHPPRMLTKQQFTYFSVGLPIGLIAVSVGIVGICVVMDTDQKSALAKTHFALLWRRAVQHNPFIQAFMLNFGAIGFGYSLVRLLEHRKAVQLQQEQQQRQQRQPVETRKDR
eukprot:GHRQ01023436.1.p1 GENE.GHRQ01023436.1~~GHRQ01023436.1.p1  ORF type:complete len:169 (+),score=14.39 GHRQ01023436.1:148-654(+)